jgi:hypothetical protein
MVKRISIRRIVGATIAGGLILGAVYCWFEHRRMDQEFLEWIDARPMDVTADLSQPGKITAPFDQTCQISHGEEIYLTVTPAADHYIASTLLDGLDGTVMIHDADGKEIESFEITSEIDSEFDAGEPIKLAYFSPFSKGEYTATIDITNGASGLSGREQTIYAKYFLCGCERMPAVVYGFFAFAFGIPGLIIAVVVTRGFIKYGLAKPQAADTGLLNEREPE